jgi:drug/metabolite transporter (DMT)-like permease
LVCVPYVIVGDLRLPAAVWTNMLVAALLAVSGNVLIVAALAESDLSVLGPINAYKSVVGLILGVFVIGEWPTPTGLAGVLLIVAGSYFVIDRNVNQPVGDAYMRFFSERGIQLRFAALFVSATEAVFLKRAIVVSSPALVFVLWSVLGFLMVVTWALIGLRREVVHQFVVLKGQLRTFVSLAAATGAMQMATLVTLRDFQVGYSLALFQLSAIVSVFLGRRYFAEANIGRRLIGSIIMAAGAALIVLAGRQN